MHFWPLFLKFTSHVFSSERLKGFCDGKYIRDTPAYALGNREMKNNLSFEF